MLFRRLGSNADKSKDARLNTSRGTCLRVILRCDADPSMSEASAASLDDGGGGGALTVGLATDRLGGMGETSEDRRDIRSWGLESNRVELMDSVASDSLSKVEKESSLLPFRPMKLAGMTISNTLPSGLDQDESSLVL